VRPSTSQGEDSATAPCFLLASDRLLISDVASLTLAADGSGPTGPPIPDDDSDRGNGGGEDNNRRDVDDSTSSAIRSGLFSKSPVSPLALGLY
jgi:hypothetical protein